MNINCPCGSERKLIDCCGPYLNRSELPKTAEKLMRSRYSANVLNDNAYLLSTWHESTKPSLVDETNSDLKWMSLKIRNRNLGDAVDSEGTVEFIAKFKINGKAHRLHEISNFLKIENKWFYVDGKIIG